jgi:hypothetical protein
MSAGMAVLGELLCINGTDRAHTCAWHLHGDHCPIAMPVILVTVHSDTAMWRRRVHVSAL